MRNCFCEIDDSLAKASGPLLEIINAPCSWLLAHNERGVRSPERILVGGGSDFVLSHSFDIRHLCFDIVHA